MRKWLAVLAFVPAVAWGDCYSVQMREAYLDVALSMLDAEERGVSEREALSIVSKHIDRQADKAAALEAIKRVYGPHDISISAIVTGMQNACYRETR